MVEGNAMSGEPRAEDASYNRVAGQSVERLAALSDGIFGVAMTLLVLDLRTPIAGMIHGERDLLSSLEDVAPALLMYLMSFITLGIFWVGQQTQLNHIGRCDRHLTWLNLGFLFAVTLLPFATQLLAEFFRYRTALLAYWLNILLLGAGLYCTWGYAFRNGLLKAGTPEGLPDIVCRRIISAQVLYAAGALLGIADTRLGIAAIVLVQLYYAVAPRFRPGPARRGAPSE
jgi:uncharacterized membrane protein